MPDFPVSFPSIALGVARPEAGLSRAVSGDQFELHWGEYSATIASVGATLRSLTFAGRDLVVPFAADEVRPGFRGATLAPWPNRIADGRYLFEGVDQQLGLTEPDRGHALHGLAVWLNFRATSVSASAVSLHATVEPQPGYPHRLELTITFSLSEDGLHTELVAVNSGMSTAPFGAGFHPYLRAGSSPLESWSLQLDASQVLLMEPSRMVPLSIEPVGRASNDDGTSLDFREPRVLGHARIDNPFTALARVNGLASAALLAPDGSGVSVSWDSRCEWVQIFTDDQGVGVISRQGVAIEPVSCPPDAFNSGTDVRSIAPHESASVGYVIAAVLAVHE